MSVGLKKMGIKYACWIKYGVGSNMRAIFV